MKNDTIKMLKNKIEFVNALEGGLTMIPGIRSVEYEVLVNPEKDYVEEFVKVTYNNGNYCVRNCSGNSLSAILQEIGRLANGGFYEDERFYLRLKADPGYIDFWEAIKHKKN